MGGLLLLLGGVQVRWLLIGWWFLCTESGCSVPTMRSCGSGCGCGGFTQLRKDRSFLGLVQHNDHDRREGVMEDSNDLYTRRINALWERRGLRRTADKRIGAAADPSAGEGTCQAFLNLSLGLSKTTTKKTTKRRVPRREH